MRRCVGLAWMVPKIVFQRRSPIVVPLDILARLPSLGVTFWITNKRLQLPGIPGPRLRRVPISLCYFL